MIKEALQHKKIQFLIKKLLFSKPRKVVFQKPVIWIYWHQGLHNAPEIVKASYFSWKRFNPDFEVQLLDKNKLFELIGFDFFSLFAMCPNASFSMAGKSDFLRLYLLYHHGGIWADATTMCLQPISSWLDFSDVDFFIFRQPEKCRDRQMVSWFMLSRKKGHLIRKLLFQAFVFLTKKRAHKCTASEKPDLVMNDITRSIISRAGTGFDYLDYCEGMGLIPYFWMFYLWNEVCKKCPKQIDLINTLPNNHVQAVAGFDEFYKSFVAKQTYGDEDDKVNNIRSQRINYIYMGNLYEPLKPRL